MYVTVVRFAAPFFNKMYGYKVELEVDKYLKAEGR
jgi:hypothetical protein